MKKTRKLIGVALVLSLIFLSSVFSFAEGRKIVLTEEDKGEIINNLIEIGVVDKSSQDNLIKKLEQGKVWDCMNRDIISKVPSNLINPTLVEPVKRYEFEDGSVLLVELFNNKDEYPKANSINSFNVGINGTGYTIVEDHRISIKSGLVGMGFTVDYCFVDGGYDYIIDARKPYCNVAGGSYSELELVIEEKYETSSRPAEAVASANIIFAGGIAGGTHFCCFKLANDDYNVTNY